MSLISYMDRSGSKSYRRIAFPVHCRVQGSGLFLYYLAPNPFQISEFYFTVYNIYPQCWVWCFLRWENLSALHSTNIEETQLSIVTRWHKNNFSLILTILANVTNFLTHFLTTILYLHTCCYIPLYCISHIQYERACPLFFLDSPVFFTFTFIP